MSADVYFSEHYGPESDATTAPPTSLPTIVGLSPTSKGGAPVKRFVSHLDFTVAADLAIDDQIRLFTLQSGDRISSLRLSTGGTWTASALFVHMGIYLPGDLHDGEVVDSDLWATSNNLDLSSAQSRTDLWQLGNILAIDRSRALWQQLTIGASSFTSDPFLDLDLTLTVTSPTSITAQGSLMVELEYTPAGTN